jgi:hypothetical protein
MLTVLKGKSVDEMREYFEKCGSGKRFIRNNLEGTQEWSSVLRQTQLSTDNIVLDWIDRMLQYDRRQRINAETLYETIRDPAGRPEFCGICCLEDDENVYSEDDLEEVIREVITVTDISTTPMSMNKGLKRSDVKIIVGLHYGATYSSMFPPLLKKIMLT